MIIHSRLLNAYMMCLHTVTHGTIKEGNYLCYRSATLENAPLRNMIILFLESNHDEAKLEGCEESKRQALMIHI